MSSNPPQSASDAAVATAAAATANRASSLRVSSIESLSPKRYGFMQEKAGERLEYTAHSDKVNYRPPKLSGSFKSTLRT